MIRRISFQALALLLLSILFGGLRQFLPRGISWTGHWPSSSTSAEEAYRMMAKPGDPPFIGLPEVIQLHDEKKSIFLDARAKELFSTGHLPAARNLPFYELEKFQDKALEGIVDTTPLIIYCEGIGCELSFFLGRELTHTGYKNIRIFYGGYPEWVNAGLPVEK